MNKRLLGKTAIEVSEISFGGVEIGIPYGIGVKDESQMLSENEAIRLLHAAVDNGINFFDTAHFYGRSEAVMGKAFKGKRDKVIIGTKNAKLRGDNESLPSAKKIRKIIDDSIEQSLSALQTDYLDLFMLHSADLEMLGNPEIIDIFTEYKRKGLTRTIGASIYSVEEIKKVIESGIWDVIQIAFSLIDQRLGEIFPLAQQHGVGVVIRSVLFMGMLTERGRDMHPELEVVKRHRDVYNELLSENTPTLPELATKFVLSHDEVSSALVGIDRMEYLQKAIDVADGNYLDEKTLARARQLAFPEPDFLNIPKWDRCGWL